MFPTARVEAVSRSAEHPFSKTAAPEIELLAGLGVAQDTQDPRQIHLIHAELFAELDKQGFRVKPGDLGESVTTRGVNLLGLPRGTLLHLGDTAVVEVTGLWNPCSKLDDFQPGLRAAVLGRDEEGRPVRKAGVMGVVRRGGVVRPGDLLRVDVPEGSPERLERV